MIKHEMKGNKHLVTPLTEKAARFLNTFVNRTVVMDEQEYRSMTLEMSSHKVWIMGSEWQKWTPETARMQRGGTVGS